VFRTGAQLVHIEHDWVRIEVVFDATAIAQPFVFALVPRKKEAAYRTNRYDLVGVWVGDRGRCAPTP
jgi:hypothetical protein